MNAVESGSARAVFRTLGHSGLVVSPLALGTMTFGSANWGSGDAASEAVFNAYIDAGGNFVDSADVYAKGRSEELLGGFIAKRALRDRVVLATKFAWQSGTQPDVNAGGNGRKHIVRALDASLNRLQTDYVDLYWLHAWDRVTPAEEVLQTLGDQVRAGKIRYFGLSNMPAWYAAKTATLARVHGVPGPVALQLEYSLAERGIEREFVPAAAEFGLGITPWSPLAGGFLTGKYQRVAGEKAQGEGRLAGVNPFGATKFNERNWRTLDALKTVSAQLGRPPAQVALAWVCRQAGICAPLIGASKVEQLRDNLASLEIGFSGEQLAVLDEASAIEPGSPYGVFSDAVNRTIFGGATVRGWQRFD